MSWLRHAKNCQIVQMNWKASGSWKVYNEVEVKKIIDESRKVFGEDLFNKSRSTDQILKQGEIDILGVEINENGISSIYGVDVAFHMAGLNYGDTLARVMKKMIRTAALITGYFDYKLAKIVFASPKIKHDDVESLKIDIEKLNFFSRTICQWILTSRLLPTRILGLKYLIPLCFYQKTLLIRQSYSCVVFS